MPPLHPDLYNIDIHRCIHGCLALWTDVLDFPVEHMGNACATHHALCLAHHWRTASAHCILNMLQVLPPEKGPCASTCTPRQYPSVMSIICIITNALLSSLTTSHIKQRDDGVFSSASVYFFEGSFSRDKVSSRPSTPSHMVRAHGTERCYCAACGEVV